MNLYIITFNDKSKFYGGTYKNTKWMDIPDKKIKEIEYFTPLGKKIHLKGYDNYYHFIEVTNDLDGDKKGQIQLEFSYLIAKKDGIYKVYGISLKTGLFWVKEYKETDKFIQQLNPIGWKGQ